MKWYPLQGSTINEIKDVLLDLQYYSTEALNVMQNMIEAARSVDTDC